MSERTGHIVVVGLAALGVRIVEELERLGEQVVVIDVDAGQHHHELVEALGVEVVHGDPSDTATLRAAGIPGARSVVLTLDGDVANIHAALAATELDPELPTVLRVFDEEFGRRVEALIPGSVALSASSIAAPGFVSAIVDPGTERYLPLLDRELAIRPADPTGADVVAVLADESVSPAVLFPAVPAGVGDGSPAPLLCVVDAAGRRGRAVTPRRRFRRMPSFTPPTSLWRRVDRRFLLLAVLIVLLVVGSAAVFDLLVDGVGPVESVYQAIKGVLGNADASVQGTTELKYFVLLLAIVGAVLVAAFYGIIVDVILRARVSNLLGPHVADARDHVIVIGFGSIGVRVASAFRDQGVAVVAADARPDPRFADLARSMGVPLVTSDARSSDMLRDLGVDRARALLAGTDDDAANLATALRARAMRPDLPIAVRLFDPDLATRLESSFGGFASRSVDALAAPAFAAAAIGRQVLATIPVGTARVLVVARVPIERLSSLDGATVASVVDVAGSERQGGGRVLAIVSSQVVRWSPRSDEVATADDELLVVATRRGLAACLRAASVHDERPVAPSRRRVRGAVGGWLAGARELVDRMLGRLRG